MSTTTEAHFRFLYQGYVLQFLADLMTATIDAATAATFQHAVQSYCDDLRPWITPTEVTTHTVFSLFADCTSNEATDVMTVNLSPEGEAFFLAWMRRQAVMMKSGNAVGHAH